MQECEQKLIVDSLYKGKEDPAKKMALARSSKPA